MAEPEIIVEGFVSVDELRRREGLPPLTADDWADVRRDVAAALESATDCHKIQMIALRPGRIGRRQRRSLWPAGSHGMSYRELVRRFPLP